MEQSNPIRDWHQIAVEMLMTDADLALLAISQIFVQDDQEAVARLVHNTRKVYDSINKKRVELTLSDSESGALDGKVARLRARLRFLGEPV
jgi:hypothetical protein